MKKIILTIAVTLIAGIVLSQSVITFCPGPGLNDGTDEGGLNGGKDSFVFDDQNTTNFGTANYAATNYSNCDNTFDLRYVTSEWNEMTINWDNKPAAGDPFSDTVRITFPYYGGPLRLNITSAYLSWKSGAIANHGFTIFPLDGNCNNACVSFASSSSDEADTLKRPYLVIYTHQASGLKDVNGNFSEIATYPNPAKDKLNIIFSVSKQKELTLAIYDFSGKVIETRKVNRSSTKTNFLQINTSDYSPGLYLYRISNSEGNATGRFVVTSD